MDRKQFIKIITDIIKQAKGKTIYFKLKYRGVYDGISRRYRTAELIFKEVKQIGIETVTLSYGGLSWRIHYKKIVSLSYNYR
ncbi:MAG: hypothetical protein ACYCS1_04260 [Gammaproteobacteria bacterium]